MEATDYSWRVQPGAPKMECVLHSQRGASIRSRACNLTPDSLARS